MNNKHYILNVNVITKDNVLENHAVILEGDRIKKITSMNELSEIEINHNHGIIHDGRGCYVAPGFIDMHSDSIENIIQPRPTSVMDFEVALMEHEKQLVNQGITTMYHSLSFLRSESPTLKDKEARKPDRMREIAELIKYIHDGNHLIRHRFHCRFDITNCEGYDTLMEYMDKDYIHLLSFIDHTPGQGQYRDLIKYREILQKYRPGLEFDQIDKIIEEKMAVPVISKEMIEKTASIAREKGIPIASHDDDSDEKVKYAYSELKAIISEFPVELSVARKAKEIGMLTVAGAPNVLLGRSHSGNLSAVEAILDNSIDILCSDYYPPALLHAVFKLNTVYRIPLWKSLNLITFNPARALGLDKDFGTIEEGKKADILIIKTMNDKPAVSKVFIDGQLVSELNYRGIKYA